MAISICSLSESDANLMVLNYANLLVSSLTDRRRLMEVALECVADFSGSRSLALWIIDEAKGTIGLEGIREGDTFARGGRTVLPLAASPFAHLVEHKRDELLPGARMERAPLPAGEGQAVDCSVLVMPVVAVNGEFFGFLVLEVDCEPELTIRQYLRVLVTTLAVSLANALLFELAVLDGLTGAYVRRFFEIRLHEELARIKRQGGSLALIMLDIDDYKDVNDHYGHAVGDTVLREFSAMLRANVRQGVDVVSRYGGDEFTILMPGAVAAEALIMAERLRNLCDQGVGRSALEPRVSFSAGVVDSSEIVPPTASGLMALVDRRLYAAKDEGRDRIIGPA